MSAPHLLGLQVSGNGPSSISKVLSLNQLPDLFIDMHGWLWRIKGNFDPNGIPVKFSGSNFGNMLATVDFFVSLGMLIIIISLEREFWSTFNTSETPTMKKCEVFEGSWKCKEFVKHMRIFPLKLVKYLCAIHFLQFLLGYENKGI